MTKQEIYKYLDSNYTKHSDFFGNGFNTAKACIIATTICYKNEYRAFIDKPNTKPTTYFKGKPAIGWATTV